LLSALIVFANAYNFTALRIIFVSSFELGRHVDVRMFLVMFFFCLTCSQMCFLLLNTKPTRGLGLLLGIYGTFMGMYNAAQSAGLAFQTFLDLLHMSTSIFSPKQHCCNSSLHFLLWGVWLRDPHVQQISVSVTIWYGHTEAIYHFIWTRWYCFWSLPCLQFILPFCTNLAQKTCASTSCKGFF
jgi:hypothetical protein